MSQLPARPRVRWPSVVETSLAFVTLVPALPAMAATVHALDQVSGILKTPEAKALVSEQMEGKPAPDRLGAHLPPGLSAERVLRLLDLSGDAGRTTLIGARPWPAQKGRYVAIVCVGGATDHPCARADDDSKGPPLRVYLGVIATEDGGEPRLVARGGPLDAAMTWVDSGLPRQPMAADDAASIPAQTFDALDLAPYRIAPDRAAFGLRGSWDESYSGGGAHFTGLYLFAAEGDRLKRVLAVPMSAYSDVAGDWHKDQTRDHDITDAADVLVVSPRLEAGHYILVLKARSGSWQRLYRWSEQAGGYQPENK